MTKQERTAKKAKKAKAQANEIVEKAVAEVKAKRGETSEEERALGQQVKEYRDKGMPWYAIAFTMGLPGSANSAAAGKSGASKARLLYKKAHGALPATPRSQAANRVDRVYGDGPKPQGVARKKHGAIDVITKDPELESMFSDEHSEEDILKMLRGKRITFTNSMAPNLQETARIHRDGKVELRETPTGRAVQFREDHSDSPGMDVKYRYRQAQIRTIILDRIVRVAS